MRKIKLKVSIEGTEITNHIIDDVISFSYTDNASHKSDDIDLTMLDVDKKWMNGWNPTTDEHIEASIIIEKDGKEQVLDCGKFTMDEPEYSSPGVISIRGVSVPMNEDFTDTKRSQSWEKSNLKNISSTLANRGNLSLDYQSSKNPSFDWKEQQEKSDMHFLAEETRANGMNLKIADEKVIIYDDDTFNSGINISIGDSDILSYSFKKALSKTRYGSCTVSYMDYKNGKKIEYTHSIGKGKKLQINQRVENLSEAKRVAENSLLQQNKNVCTGSLSLVGRVDLFAGSLINLIGFGVYSGCYFIEKVGHSVSNGYGIQIDIRSKE